MMHIRWLQIDWIAWRLTTPKPPASTSIVVPSSLKIYRNSSLVKKVKDTIYIKSTFNEGNPMKRRATFSILYNDKQIAILTKTKESLKQGIANLNFRNISWNDIPIFETCRDPLIENEANDTNSIESSLVSANVDEVYVVLGEATSPCTITAKILDSSDNVLRQGDNDTDLDGDGNVEVLLAGLVEQSGNIKFKIETDVNVSQMRMIVYKFNKNDVVLEAQLNVDEV